MSLADYQITPLGDGAMLIRFGNRIDEAINKKVLSIFQQLKTSALPLLDVVPAYASLGIYYDVRQWRDDNHTAYDAVKQAIEPFLQGETLFETTSRTMKIPVCYEESFAPDLKDVAQRAALTPNEVIAIHTAAIYRVFMIGFQPGFPYMGTVDSRIAAPRKPGPRTAVPAGSVGIAGEQTGVYPFASPGGWNLIGCTPVRLFDKDSKQPSLLQPGDAVTFYPITAHEFNRY